MIIFELAMYMLSEDKDDDIKDSFYEDGGR